jgi:hypothetical protein
MLIKEGYVTSLGGIFGRTYDVSLDGLRFLMLKEAGDMDQASAPPQIIVVQHIDRPGILEC